MLKAIHPSDNILIDYNKYKEFTLKEGYQNIQDAPKARCPVCNEEVNSRAGNRKDNGHFYHQDHSKCPTIESNNQFYHYLYNAHIDKNAKNRNEEFLKENISKIYKKIGEIVPFLDLKEFIEILREAKRLNIYSYAYLEPSYLPYIFVTLINFIPNKSLNKKRRLKFSFFYRTEIKNLNELWINRGNSSSLIRVSYNDKNLEKITEIDINLDYLNMDSNNLSEKQIKWLNKEI